MVRRRQGSISSSRACIAKICLACRNMSRPWRGSEDTLFGQFLHTDP
jgi:hypothetical protein